MKRQKEPGKDSLLPGLSLVVSVSVLVLLVEPYIPLLNGVLLAILAGVVIRNTCKIPKAMEPGIRFTIKMLLKVAIVLMGASLNFATILSIGGQSLALIAILVSVSIPLTLYLGKMFNSNEKLSILIGVGTAICGASAIIATGPAIEAEEEDISLAIATIFIFNAAALVIYPFLGTLFAMSDPVFGTWVGSAVHDTTSVIATGMSFSNKAGEIAVIVKLTRTLFLIPVLITMGLYASRRSEDKKSKTLGLQKAFPWFIVLFLVMAVLNTASLFPPEMLEKLGILVKFLILWVMVAVGMGVDIRRIRSVGLNFLTVGLLSSVIVAILSLLLIRVLQIQ